MTAVQARYDFSNTSQYGISDHFYMDSGNSSASILTVVAAAVAGTLISKAVEKRQQVQ